MLESKLLSDVDSILSQVNVLLTEANMKLSQCPDPVQSRNFILSRVQHILEEVQWTVSLSEEDVSSNNNNNTSPDVSMEWDDFGEESYYQTVFIDEETECEDDHGQCSVHTGVSSADDSDDSLPLSQPTPRGQEILDHYNRSKFDVDVSHCPTNPEMVILTPVLRKFIPPKTGPPIPVSSSEEDANDEDEDFNEDMSEIVPDDVSKKYIEAMCAKIELLAPDGVFKIAKPVEYKIDLSKVNYSFRVRNIPDPGYYPVLGVSQDPNFYDREYWYKHPENKRNYYNYDVRSGEYPHGRLHGYLTNVGIVPVPEEPVHGYVFRNGSWILHAEVDDGSPSRNSWFQPSKRGRPRG